MSLWFVPYPQYATPGRSSAFAQDNLCEEGTRRAREDPNVSMTVLLARWAIEAARDVATSSAARPPKCPHRCPASVHQPHGRSIPSVPAALDLPRPGVETRLGEPQSRARPRAGRKAGRQYQMRVARAPLAALAGVEKVIPS